MQITFFSFAKFLVIVFIFAQALWTLVSVCRLVFGQTLQASRSRFWTQKFQFTLTFTSRHRAKSTEPPSKTVLPCWTSTPLRVGELAENSVAGLTPLRFSPQALHMDPLWKEKPPRQSPFTSSLSSTCFCESRVCGQRCPQTVRTFEEVIDCNLCRGFACLCASAFVQQSQRPVPVLLLYGIQNCGSRATSELPAVDGPPHSQRVKRSFIQSVSRHPNAKIEFTCQDHCYCRNPESRKSQDEVNAEIYGELSTNLFKLDKVCWSIYWKLNHLTQLTHVLHCKKWMQNMLKPFCFHTSVTKNKLLGQFLWSRSSKNAREPWAIHFYRIVTEVS